MKVLYFDCFSGASGDMVLGALLDAGVPLDDVRRAIASLPLEDVELDVERVDRSGIGATKLNVRVGGLPVGGTTEPTDSHDHGHTHEHDQTHDHGHTHHDHGHEQAHTPVENVHRHNHHHRGLSDISAMVDASAVSSAVGARAKTLFRRLAETEAAIHQMPVEQVHLHEVGAVDSIVDIVGAVVALEAVGVGRFVSSPLNVGSGTVRCAHGVLPVPAPATARLLEGVPVYSTGVQAELLTPTGALIITDYAETFGPLPAMRIDRIGYGAGARDLPGGPNVLRVLIGETGTTAGGDRVVVIESEIDDMNPQIYGVLMERLLAAGALDVFYAPIQMKKNRPGTLVTVVARPQDRAVMTTELFRETTTIGVRLLEMERECLVRSQVVVETPLGPIRFKTASRDGSVVNAVPEFDDCAAVAREHNVSVKEVQAIATNAYLNARGAP